MKGIKGRKEMKTGKNMRLARTMKKKLYFAIHISFSFLEQLHQKALNTYRVALLQRPGPKEYCILKKYQTIFSTTGNDNTNQDDNIHKKQRLL